MTDWTIIGGDPAPGNPDLIRASVTQLRVSEEAVRQVEDALGRIARGTTDADWEGECATAMREVLDGFRHDLMPIAESFLRVRRALGGYVAELVDLQASARQAMRRAEVAESRRRASEAQKQSGSDLLAQQRRQMAANQAAQARHAAVSAVQNAADPSAAPANAQEAHRLARNTQATQRAVSETQRTIGRLDGEIQAAVAELGLARRRASDIHDEWDRIGRQAADQVDDALAAALKNKSNLEKLRKRVMDDLHAIGEFLADPLHHLSLLRGLIDTLHDILGTLASILTLAACIVAFLGPAGLALAGVLATVAFGLTVAALVLSITKLVLDAALYNLDYTEDGELVVTRGDLVMDAFDIGTDGLSVFLSRGAGSAVSSTSGAVEKVAASEAKLAMKAAAKTSEDYAEDLAKDIAKGAIEDRIEEGLASIVMPPTKTHPRCTVVIPPRAIAAVEAPTVALSGGGGW